MKRESIIRAFSSLAAMCAAEERKRHVRWFIGCKTSALAMLDFLIVGST